MKKTVSSRIPAMLLVLLMTLVMLPFSALAEETANGGKIPVYLSVVDPYMDAEDQYYKDWLAAGNNPLPGNGVLFEEQLIYVDPGETAFGILFYTGLDIHYNYHAIWAGAYVSAINGWGEFDGGQLSGWMYRVDDEYPAFSSSLYELYDYARVEWIYTRELGEDVGGSFEGGPPPVGEPGEAGGDSGNSTYFSVAPSKVSINDDILARKVTLGGELATQQASFLIDKSALPDGITVEVGGDYGTNLIITGERPAYGQAPVKGSYAVPIRVKNDSGSYANYEYIVVTLTVNADLEPLEPDFTYGDVNGDGAIDARDTILLRRYIAKQVAADAINLDASDVNGDGVVDARDTILLRRYIARHPVTLGPQG